MNIHPRTAWIYQMAGHCQGWGGMGRQDRWRHGPEACPRAGWAGRPTPVLPCAQDGAHEQGAIEPPWLGLRRVLPAHTAPPTSVAAFAVASAPASAGAGRQPGQYPATFVYTSVVHSAAIMPPGATRSGRGRKQEQDVAWAAGRCVWKQGRCLSCCWCGWRCRGWAMRAASTLVAITFWSAPRQPNLRHIARARRRCWPGRASRHG